MNGSGSECKPIAIVKVDLLSKLLSEISAELRSRRDPEHLYTAASVGVFGAVAWGVAALGAGQPQFLPMSLTHPALVGGLGVSVVAGAVIAKIVREHRNYMGLREVQVNTARRLVEETGLDEEFLPPGLRKLEASRGYLWSVALVAASAVASALFCLSIWVGP